MTENYWLKPHLEVIGWWINYCLGVRVEGFNKCIDVSDTKTTTALVAGFFFLSSKPLSNVFFKKMCTRLLMSICHIITPSVWLCVCTRSWLNRIKLKLCSRARVWPSTSFFPVGYQGGRLCLWLLASQDSYTVCICL